MIFSTTFSATLARPAAALLLAGLAAGCAQQQGGVLGLGPNFSTSADYRDVYPISIDIAPFLIEIEAADRLSEIDMARVDAFAREFRAAGEGEITVAYPNDADADDIVHEIVARLRREGVAEDLIVTGAYSTAVDGDRGVVVSYYAADAEAPECPELWGDSMIRADNEHSGRMGCWAQRNLATMVVQPRDLLEPRPTTPALADRRADVLEAYAEGQATAADLNRERTATTD